MLKKVAFALMAGSLVFAAQVASADDTQFWTGETYQGVSALPFDALSRYDRSDAKAPMAVPQIERLTPRESVMEVAIFPMTYDSDTGRFN